METTRSNNNSVRLWLRLGLLSCIIFGQLTAQIVEAQTQSSSASPIQFTNGISYEYDKLLTLATQVQTNKPLYDYLNKELVTFLMITAEKQSLYEWGEKSKGLSEHQILAILQNSPELTSRVQTYLAKVNANNLLNADIVALRKTMQTEFEDFLKNKPELLERLRVLSDQTQAFVIQTPNEKSAISEIDVFVNHPRIEAGKTIPAEDLKLTVKEFIGGAKTEIWANFFDFDLMDVAEKFAEKATQGVAVNVGIDANVITARPQVKAVADYLESFRSKGLDLVPINSVGLNHMKIIVRDPNGPNAAVLLLSGNLTQSCIGKEGDLVDLPESIRPKESVPNANHTVLIKGSIPAIFARHHLVKVLKMGMRGQSGFPIGGAYKFYSKPTPTANVKTPWMILSFSPNGGMGDINNDILKQLLLTTTGPVRFLQFAFSSKVVTDAAALRIQREKMAAQAKGYSYTPDFGAVGDAVFAMREFSSLLTMSGMQKSLETNIYSEDLSNPFAKALTPAELQKTRSQMLAAPTLYSERSVTVNGQSYPLTSKIHHKIMIVSDWFITVAGTSFNFSVNAESNNEQIAIFRDEKVARIITGAYEWLKANSRGTVYELATKRNISPRPPKEVKSPKDPLTAVTCQGLF
jgi:hypothetical protein